MSGAKPHKGLRVGPIRRALGRAWMRAFGWTIDGELPPGVDKAIFVAAPHTSNWDGPHMIAVAWALGVHLSWMGKKELFRFPFRGFLRSVGGVPVDRKAPKGLVEDVARTFAETDAMYLAIAPSGTRHAAPYWKSGFHRIAKQANVPIVLGYLDYGRKRGGCGPTFVPSEDLAADMERIRAFYGDVSPRIQERLTPVRLREEEAGASGPASEPAK